MISTNPSFYSDASLLEEKHMLWWKYPYSFNATQLLRGDSMPTQLTVPVLIQVYSMCSTGEKQNDLNSAGQGERMWSLLVDRSAGMWSLIKLAFVILTMNPCQQKPSVSICVCMLQMTHFFKRGLKYRLYGVCLAFFTQGSYMSDG